MKLELEDDSGAVIDLEQVSMFVRVVQSSDEGSEAKSSELTPGIMVLFNSGHRHIFNYPNPDAQVGDFDKMKWMGGVR